MGFMLGEVVKVKEDLEVNKYYGTMYAGQRLVDNAGKLGVVMKVGKYSDTYALSIDGSLDWLWFSEEMLQETTDAYGDEEKEDVINHPNHYTNRAMECIEEMKLLFGKEAVMNFCLCNAWKYRYRANSKNGEEDLKKADRYIQMYKEMKEEE